MSIDKKIDFAAVVSVRMANPNGDPLAGNRPRINYGGFGEISDVAIKRKIRNRVQQEGGKIFVQSEDFADDGFDSLKARWDAFVKENDVPDQKEALVKAACKEWFDVRAFGALLAFSGKNKTGVSIGIRGPVSIHSAISVDPVLVSSVQITKSVNSESSDKRGSDTMGLKHRVDGGVYVFYGSVNPYLAKKTGFSEEDSETLKMAITSLFENDSSAARPEGSMVVESVYWWTHDSPAGQYPSAKVHRSMRLLPKPGVDSPASIDDYIVELESLPGLEPEIICP